MAAIGVAIGIGGALALTRVLQASLYEVRATDPLTFYAVPALLFLVSAAAFWPQPGGLRESILPLPCGMSDYFCSSLCSTGWDVLARRASSRFVSVTSAPVLGPSRKPYEGPLRFRISGKPARNERACAYRQSAG